LVAFIKEHYDFCVGAAFYPEKHPEAPSAEEDLRHLKAKVDAGVDFLNSQMFFDNRAYFDFIGKAKAIGITAPLVPGIMPVTTPKFFSRDFGVSYPPGFREGFLGGDAEADKAYGLDFAAKQCRELLAQGAPGLHLYIMNKAENSQVLWKATRP
jgi:methylenetetrahydrofolate reductase (NADPH)